MYKYLIAQLICFLLDVLLFYFLISFDVDIFHANLISKSTSGILSFFMLSLLVFYTNKSLSSTAFLKYLILWISNIIVSSYLVVLLNSVIAIAVLSKLIIDFIMFNLNFLISKYVVFRVRR